MHTVPTRPEWLTGGNMYMNHELETCVTYPSKTKHVHMFSFFFNSNSAQKAFPPGRSWPSGVNRASNSSLKKRTA